MAKGKKTGKGEEEVLDQIFDFIFKEAKKPVDKRKPLKRGGSDPSSAMTDALSAALEMPGVFVTDQILSNVNDALTIEVGRLKADESGVPKAKFTTSSLVNFLADPNGFLSKPKESARSARASMKAEIWGKRTQEFLMNAWAKKYDLDMDTRKAIRTTYVARDSDQRIAGRALAKASGMLSSEAAWGDSEKNIIATRRIELIARNTFGEENWKALSDEDKEGFQEAIMMDARLIGDRKKNITTSLDTSRQAFSYAEEYLQRMGRSSAITSYKRALPAKLDLFDRGQYIEEEAKNLDTRINKMRNDLTSGNLSPNQAQAVEHEIAKLEQASVLVSGQYLDSQKIYLAQDKLGALLTDSENKLREAIRNRDGKEARFYQEQIRDLKESKRNLSQINFFGKVGKAEGFVNSWKDIMGGIGGENMMTSILSGTFFDSDQNDTFLRPSDNTKVIMGYHSIDTTDTHGRKFARKEAETIQVYKPKTSGNGLVNVYYKTMGTLYYFTPRSIMRTLFVNGEGFIYMAMMRKMHIEKELGLGGGLEIDIAKVLGNDAEHLNKLVEFLKKKNPGKTDEQIQNMLKGHLSGLAGVGKLAQFFSKGQRIRDYVGAWLNEKVYKKMRQVIYNVLVKKVAGEGAKAALEAWLAKGGFETLAKALVTTVLNALGITATGGVGAFIVPVLSAVVADVLYNVAKVLIQVVLLVLMGVAGLFVFGGSSIVNKFSELTYAYTNVTPGEVVYNPDFIDEEYIISGGEPGAPGTVYTGDIEEIYNQVAAEMGLNTKLKLVTCTTGDDGFDEAACNLIDWAWCYSGTQIFCKADKLATASDAGLTNLFRHELLHQIQRGGGGLLREWGADFLSNNGGGYSFVTSSGSIQRATETAGYLTSTGVCTYSDLEALAIAPGSSTPCGNLLKSYIKSFATRN